MHNTFEATVDGVDRYLLVWGSAEGSIDPDKLELAELRNCRPGRSYVFASQTAKAFEVLLDRTLDAGDCYTLSCEINFRAAARPGRAKTTSALQSFRMSGPVLSLEVEFTPPALPINLRRVGRRTLDEPASGGEPLRLNALKAAQMIVDRPAIGAYGIQWDWP